MSIKITNPHFRDIPHCETRPNIIVAFLLYPSEMSALLISKDSWTTTHPIAVPWYPQWVRIVSPCSFFKKSPHFFFPSRHVDVTNAISQEPQGVRPHPVLASVVSGMGWYQSDTNQARAGGFASFYNHWWNYWGTSYGWNNGYSMLPVMVGTIDGACKCLWF